eukprot:scaffold22616_cov143-Isochrysis_galbana.AAC.2
MPNKPGPHTEHPPSSPPPPPLHRVYERLQSRNLVWTNPRFARLDTCGSWDEVRACRQFRFRHVVDPETKERIVELEHETRSLRHFQFGKHVHYSPLPP